MATDKSKTSPPPASPPPVEAPPVDAPIDAQPAAPPAVPDHMTQIEEDRKRRLAERATVVVAPDEDASR